MRIKELYPYALQVERDDENTLHPSAQNAKAFENAKIEFTQKTALHGELLKNSRLTNITEDTRELCDGYGTKYVIVSCRGGKCYDQIEEEDPKLAILHTIAVAKAVAQFHKSGCLYLDLKPQNLFILDETPDMVVLLDYGSCVSNSLEETDRISCSRGFSAPELLHEWHGSISFCTDIYSVGALLFYRLMGRTASAADREYGAEYNFDKFRERCKTYPPRFFHILEGFFHKTLAATPELRFQEMKEVTDCLKELRDAANPNEIYVKNKFSFAPNRFIGRCEELAEIDEYLRTNNTLFIHGLPGIGKTELAHCYISSIPGRYRTRLVLHWQGSVRRTLMSVVEDDLLCNYTKQEEGESNDAFYKRIKSSLFEALSKDDIVLLDNLDKPDDPELKELFARLECKLLITARLHFVDFNDRQIELKSLSNEELVELFMSYSGETFLPEEEAKVCELIEYVQKHTMTVALLAKYIKAKRGFTSPGKLLTQMRENEKGLFGLSNTIRIEHQKDNDRRTESIKQHLLALFDVTKLSEKEKNLLRGLVLFGNVRISVERLFSWFGWSNDDEATDEALNHLNNLISYGWVEEKDNQVFLHQVILDLMYGHLKPTEDNCGQLMDGLLRYLESVPEMNSVEKFAARQLLYNVHSRLQDGGERMVEFDMEFLWCFLPDWEDPHLWVAFHPVEVEQLRTVLDDCENRCLTDEASYSNELALLYFLKVKWHILLLLSPDFEKNKSYIQNVQRDCDAAVEYLKQSDLSLWANGFLRYNIAICFDVSAEFCEGFEQRRLLDNAGMYYEDAVKMLEEANAPEEVLYNCCNRVGQFFLGSLISGKSLFIRTEEVADMSKAIFYNGKVSLYNYKMKYGSGLEKVGVKRYNRMMEQFDNSKMIWKEDQMQKYLGFLTKILVWMELNGVCFDANLALRCVRAGFSGKFKQIGWSSLIEPYVETSILYYRRDGLLDQARRLCRECIEKQTAALQWSKGSTANNTARLLLNTKYQLMQLAGDASEREAIHDELLALYGRYIEPSAITGVAQEFVYELALQAEGAGRPERAEELFLRALDVPLPDCEIQEKIIGHLLALAERYGRSEKKASLLLKAVGPLARNGSGQDVKTLCRAIEEDIRSGKLSEPYLKAQTYYFLGWSWMIDPLNVGNRFIDDEGCGEYRERCNYDTLAERNARRGDRWHAVICWRQAACLYEIVCNKEKAADCIECALDFWTPLMSSKVKAAPSHSLVSLTSSYSFGIGIHSESWFDFSIENYLTVTYNLIAYWLAVQDTSKAQKLMRKMPEIAVGYLAHDFDASLYFRKVYTETKERMTINYFVNLIDSNREPEAEEQMHKVPHIVAENSTDDIIIDKVLTAFYDSIAGPLGSTEKSEDEVDNNNADLSCVLCDFCKKMMTLWYKAGDPVQACVSWMKWIMFQSDPSVENACAVLLYDAKETEDRFLEILSSEPSQELVDLIIPDLGGWKNVWPFTEGRGRKACELFLETHRALSIEVKSRTRTSVSGADIS